MHSRDQLTGTLCKCMACAQARYKRLEKETRLRYRDEYNEWQEVIDNAERALDEAKFQLSNAQAERKLLIERVRKEINA